VARLALSSSRSPDWLKMKNPDAPAVQREAEETRSFQRHLSLTF
jgi:hypothetical protein